jgi:AcrR family transcriptional regulator
VATGSRTASGRPPRNRRESGDKRRNTRKNGADGVPAPSSGGSRERILTSALEIFSERGFDGTTTRDIAARARVNLGLIKYYFDNKEKLWRAAIDRIFESLWSGLARNAAPTFGDRQAIAELLRECVRFAARNPAFVRLMNDEGKRDGTRMRWLVDRHGKRMYDLVTSVLESGRAAGLVPDVPPLHLYYALLGSTGLIFSQAPECRRLTGNDPTTSEALIEAHANALVKIYLPDAADL